MDLLPTALFFQEDCVCVCISWCESTGGSSGGALQGVEEAERLAPHSESGLNGASG